MHMCVVQIVCYHVSKLHVWQNTPVYPSQVTLSPGKEPGGGSKISRFLGELAHITIASESIPRILEEHECDLQTLTSDLLITNYS